MPAEVKRGRGRPPVYDEEQATEILRRMAEGESLRSICASNPDFPAESTVRGWAVDDEPPGFGARYARARILMAEYWADEIVDISDGEKSDGPADRAQIDRDRLRADARKWVVSKLVPAYKPKVEHSGHIGVTIDQLLADTDEEPG
jgi:hypothetical protein